MNSQRKTFFVVLSKLTPVIPVAYDATYYEVQIVLEVSILAFAIAVVLGRTMNSKSATFNILRTLPLYQRKEDGSTASLNQLRHDYLAFATDKSPYAELAVATLKQCSGTNRIKFCRKEFYYHRRILFVPHVPVLPVQCSGSSKLSWWINSVTWCPASFLPRRRSLLRHLTKTPPSDDERYQFSWH